MPDGSCPKCGGTEILEGVRLSVATGGSTGDVQAVVTPTSGMFRQQTGSGLRASICASCGYSELFVSDPATLAERWRAGER
jgi:predicted nucleic-acid-binding Zn-ribbon protein